MYLSHAFCVHQVARDLPPIFIGISSEPHRNLIGISPILNQYYSSTNEPLCHAQQLPQMGTSQTIPHQFDPSHDENPLDYHQTLWYRHQ